MPDETPDQREPVDYASPTTDAPAEPSTGGAKLFVIFFLTIVPLLGMAIMGFVIYRLLAR
jgi:hypothetical protein